MLAALVAALALGSPFSSVRASTIPALQTATVDWTRLTLTFDAVLAGDSVPPASAFAVLVGGAARDLAGVSVSEASAVLALTFRFPRRTP